MDVAILIVRLVFLGHVWECHGRSLFGSTLLHSEYVEIEITEHDVSGRYKRSVNSFPSEVQVLVKTQKDHIAMNLTLVKEIVKMPTLITLTDKGLYTENNPRNSTPKAFYQEETKFSAFTIHRKEDTSFDVHGTFIRDEELYMLEPTSEHPDSTVHRLSKVDSNDLDYTRDYMTVDGKRNHHTNRHRRSTRNRRQEKRVMSLEYVVVTDYKLYSKWYEDTDSKLSPEYRDLWTKYLMMEFYHHIVNGMDMIFKSTQSHDIELHVVLAGVVISNTTGSTSWTENQLTCPDCDTVDDQNVLLEFAKWRRKSLLPRLNHDHAALFTGYDLYYKDANSRKTVGLSYLSMMCGNWSVAVVEDHRNHLSSHLAAHELGHSLGAGHDGRDGITCSDHDMYLMAPKMSRVTDPTKAHNRWSFSHCSMDDVLGFIGTLDRDNKNCLLNNPEGQPSPFVKQAGQTYSGDDQCKFTFGEKSSVCREHHYHDWASVCYGLACRNPDTKTCRMTLPHDGTPCGNKHWCQQGQCVPSEEAMTFDGQCIMGDDPDVNCTTPNCTIYNIKYGYCCDSCRKLNILQITTVNSDTDSLLVQTLKDNLISTTKPTQTTQNLIQDDTTVDINIDGDLIKNAKSTIVQPQPEQTTTTGLLVFTLESKAASAVQSSTKSVSIDHTIKTSENLKHTTTEDLKIDGSLIHNVQMTTIKPGPQNTSPEGLLVSTLGNTQTTAFNPLATSENIGNSAKMTEIPTHATTDDLKIDGSLVHTFQSTAGQSVTQHTIPSDLRVFTIGLTKGITSTPSSNSAKKASTMSSISTENSSSSESSRKTTQQSLTTSEKGTTTKKVATNKHHSKQTPRPSNIPDTTNNLAGSHGDGNVIMKPTTEHIGLSFNPSTQSSTKVTTDSNLITRSTQTQHKMTVRSTVSSPTSDLNTTDNTTRYPANISSTVLPNIDMTTLTKLTSSQYRNTTAYLSRDRYFDSQLENMITVFVSMTMFL